MRKLNENAFESCAPEETDRKEKPGFCPRCGAKTGSGSRFCASCGLKLAQGSDLEQSAGGVARTASEPKATRGEYIKSIPAWDLLPPPRRLVRRGKSDE